MREEFEKLPEIADRLDGICWNDDLNIYQTEYPILFNAVGFINGALYTYQEQQKKIDAVIKTVDWHIEDCGIVEETEYNKAWHEAMLFVKQELLK